MEQANIEGHDITYSVLIKTRFLTMLRSHYDGGVDDVVDSIHVNLFRLSLMVSYAHDGWIKKDNRKNINLELSIKRSNTLQLIVWKLSSRLWVTNKK